MSAPDSAQTPALLVVTPAELFWITVGLWIGGVCLLALLPVILMPRLGPAMSLAVSYLLFFVSWQPVQRLTQRALAPRAAFIRMLALVATAAMVAYYLREALMTLVSRAG
jgi:hypothetical protein